MATMKVQQQPNGQMQVTIPTALASALNIKKGQQVLWRVAGAGKLELVL